jgi:hypothetical protein
VVDFFAPIRLPFDAFEQLVSLTDQGVGSHAIALRLEEDLPFRALEIVQPLGEASPANFASLIDDLDQVLFFAFEGAPEEVIRAWARDRDMDLQEEALRRVEYVRKNMPNLADLWDEKSTSIVPPLVGLRYDLVCDGGGSVTAAIMYMSAARINGIGRPDLTDAIRLRFQLWPGDVDLLIAELQHLRDAHFGDGDREGVEHDSDRAAPSGPAAKD